MKRIIFLSVIFLFAGGLVLVQDVFAQGFSIGISPVTFELTGNPGDVIENYVRVYNPNAENIVGIKIEVEDIAPTGEAGYVIVEPAETETYSLARWLKAEPEEFNLNPGEEKVVRFTVTVPENAEPGGHYGTILASTKAVAGPGVTGAMVIQRVGSLVLLTVPGEMKEELIVKEFTAPGYSEYGPIAFVVKLENKGTVHVRPVALVTITDFMGKKVADIALTQRNILPEAVRKYEISLDKKWLLGGKYTAALVGNYGISNTSLIPTVVTFWVFPWKFGLGILVVLILIILSKRRWAAAFRVLIKGESKRVEAD